MSVNNSYRFAGPITEKYINIPLEIKWDFSGREDDIERYTKTITEQVIGSPGQFEISRYSHKEYGQNNITTLNYDFYLINYIKNKFYQ